MYSFLAVCCFLGFAEYTEVSASTLQPDDDPLLAAVSLLEANWISVQEIFELVNRVLTRIFVGLWPKQKAKVLDDVYARVCSCRQCWASKCRGL
jgi:hypothetical protein